MAKNNTIQNNNNNNNNNDNNNNYQNNTNNNRNNNDYNKNNKNNNNNNHNNNVYKDGGVILVIFGESFGGLGAVMGASNLVELQTWGCAQIEDISCKSRILCKFPSFDGSNGGY